MKKVYIIVVNYNGWADTIECLESVFRNDYPNYRVIVVDNNSTNHSMEYIRAWAEGRLDVAASHDNPLRHLSFPPVPKPVAYVEYCRAEAEAGGGAEGKETRLVLIQNEANLGFAGGNNVAIRYALAHDAMYFFLLNNDAMCSGTTVGVLLNVAAQADAAIVGARVFDKTGAHLLFSGRRWPAHLFGFSRPPALQQDGPFWPSGDVDGCAIMLRRDLLEQRDLEQQQFLDPAFFMYAEETDLCLYAAMRGFRCVVARDAVVYHGLAQSSGGKGGPLPFYYITRNRIFLARRWLNIVWLVLFHLYYVPSRIVLQVLRRNTNKETRQAIVSGLKDGYAGVAGKWRKHGSNIG
jgi:GT2 family glycosyltransferase